MSHTPAQGDVPTPAALREIPKWAQRYAENRTLAVLVALAVTFLAAALIGGLSAAAGAAWSRGHFVVGVAFLIADVAFCVWWVWLCLSKRLQPLVWAGGQWFYRREGVVTPPQAPRRETPLDRAVGIGFALAVLATVWIAGSLNIPLRYLQPITVLYTVPFMVYLSLAHPRYTRPFMLLWPALYALHGVLVLVGVPLLANLHPMLAIVLPMNLYGLVAILASHLYSRYALRRLRALAQTNGDAEGDTDGAE